MSLCFVNIISIKGYAVFASIVKLSEMKAGFVVWVMFVQDEYMNKTFKTYITLF